MQTESFFKFQPLKPGEKRVWEDWEAIWYVGCGVSVLIVALGFMYKPDTRYVLYTVNLKNIENQKLCSTVLGWKIIFGSVFILELICFG